MVWDRECCAASRRAWRVMEADQRPRLSLALHSSNQRVQSLRFSAQHATNSMPCNGLRHMAIQTSIHVGAYIRRCVDRLNPPSNAALSEWLLVAVSSLTRQA